MGESRGADPDGAMPEGSGGAGDGEQIAIIYSIADEHFGGRCGMGDGCGLAARAACIIASSACAWAAPEASGSEAPRVALPGPTGSGLAEATWTVVPAGRRTPRPGTGFGGIAPRGTPAAL